MSARNASPHTRRAFPRTAAAVLAVKRGALYSTRAARGALDFTSVWTTAVVAGLVGLGLAFLLFAFGPPPDAAVSTPSQLAVDLSSTRVPPDWDENVVHESSSEPTNAALAAGRPRDNWSAATVRPEAADLPVHRPYFLRAPQADTSVTAALEASDLPAGESGPAFVRHVGVTIEKLPSAGAPEGLAQYQWLVRNAGYDAADQVVVRELVPDIRQVIDVTPPAAVMPDGALLWQLGPLAAGEEVRLTVTIQPAADGATESVAQVDVWSQFGVRTAVVDAAQPAPFSPFSDQPQLAVPEPVLPADDPPAVATATGATIGFDDELPPSSVALPAESPAAAPASVIPFDDEVPATVAETTPAAAPVLPGAFSAQEEPANSAPFDPFANTASPEEPLVTTTSDSDTPIEPELVPDVATPAATAPVVPADDGPGWAPRPLPLDTEQPAARPIVSIKAISPTTVRKGEVVTAYYDIVNMGDAPAENVVLTVHLPQELLHRHGELVEHHIDRLEPGESRRARLLARARATGTARLDATLSLDDRDEKRAEVSIRVVGDAPATRRPR